MDFANQVDFYNNVATYLSALQNTTIRTLADIIAANDASALEGGEPASFVGVPFPLLSLTDLRFYRE